MDKPRAYTESHPWITFKFDFNKLDPHCWLLLGEIASKIDHLSTAPMRPEVRREFHRLMLVRGAHATTAIEGNTLSEEMVGQIEKGKTEVPPSQSYLRQEVENVLRAFGHITKAAAARQYEPVKPEFILHAHKLIMTNLPYEKGQPIGVFRSIEVGVARYAAPPAQDCPYLVDKLRTWLNEPEWKREHLVAYGVIRAILAHLYLAWIHPFADGNGRTARAIEFSILLDARVPHTAAHLLSSHYNATRAEYYRQLDRSSKAKGPPFEFIRYALQGFADGLRDQVRTLTKQHIDLAWTEHIYEIFQTNTGSAAKRQRDLALAIGRNEEGLSSRELGKLPTDLIATYMRLHARTLVRDLRKLVDMQLIRIKDERWRANKDIVLSTRAFRRS